MIKRVIWVGIFLLGVSGFFAFSADQPKMDEQEAQLKDEIKNMGWIAFSRRSENGTWDLFLSRPDGTQRRNITNTPDFEEAAPRFSPDNTKLLYRRLAKGTKIDHDNWGFQGQLVIAEPNGSNPQIIGEDKEFPWASWSPDGKQIVCLTPKAIIIVDLATKEIVRQLPRQGIYQQLFWSNDGKWLVGTGNVGQKSWRVVRINVETGELNPVSMTQSCTPDWFPDSLRVIYSTRPEDLKSNDGYGWTLLYMADGSGDNPQLIYAEEGYHVYGGDLSPDSQYLLFTKYPQDGGGAEKAGAPMFVMRMADAPTIHGDSPELRSIHSNVKNGPTLFLFPAWEPCWTYAEIGGTQ
ncbi:MAG: hypothetical protein ABIH23_25345 [bacterium]